MRLALPLLLLMAAACPVSAAESDAVRSQRDTATLVSDTDQVAAGTPFHIGLRLRLAPGWHTYWRNPGDAGVPAEINVEASSGTSTGPIVWPAPERLQEGPLMTYAYTGEVLLPMTVTPGAGRQAITATANWLVCGKICVPEEGRFTLQLASGTPSPSAEGPLFARAAAQTPLASPFAAEISPDGMLSLTGEALSPATVRDAWFIPDGDGAIEGSAPQLASVESGDVLIRLKLDPHFKPGAKLGGVVGLRDGHGQISYVQIEAMPGAMSASPALPFLQAMAFALLGGLILNLMPCVFPILVMKAVGIAGLSIRERGEVRAHAAFYIVGVVLAFAAMGSVLLAGRAAGGAIGWGFQLQSPVVVTALAWLLFMVGLSLSGVFELGYWLAGAGQGLASRGGYLGSFCTGLLAVVVATPCVAPFMGAAIASALALPSALTLLIFVAMGVGMALPYAILAVAPQLVRLLPRPGGWMDVVRGALAFPMYAAAAWLLWVVSVQAGETGVLVAASGAVLLALAGWITGLTQQAPRHRRLVGRVAACVIFLGPSLLLNRLANAPPLSPVVEQEGAERFTPARLAALRAEGRPVFVNMTAAWCVTCLVNDRLTLSSTTVQGAFAHHNVAYLKGDWTRGDPAITSFLREHARDGVPLYVLYSPGTSAPLLLPQILTETAIVTELDKLGG